MEPINMFPGRYFEDFNIGDCWKTPSRTISETEIVMFNSLVGLVEPLFVDMEFVREKTLFKKRFATGLMIIPVSAGLVTQLHLIDESALAMLGLDAKMINPLFPDDTIYVDVEVVSKKETSKLDRGVIVFKYTTKNQRGEVVCETIETTLLLRRSDSSV